MSEPTPISLRAAFEADGPALAALHVEAWKETYPGLVPAALLASLSVEVRTSLWRNILRNDGGGGDPGVFLAESDGCLAGFVSCGPQRTQDLQAAGFDCEVRALYVLRAFQNQRVGRRLMAAAGANLRDRGFKAASLWVLRDNVRARRFYERLGGREGGGRRDFCGEHVLVEVAYGWSNLDRLARTAALGT